MTLDGIENTGITGPGSIQRPDHAKPSEADSTSPVKPQDGERTDSARFTPDSEEVARYQEMAQLHREAYGPADRSEKLDEVRQRIESGHYDDPEVLEKIAGGLSRAAQAVEESDVERASRRSEQGFYDRPEVIDKTAENMLRDILPPQRDE